MNTRKMGTTKLIFKDLVFFMRPCPIREHVRKLITDMGGEMTNYMKTGVIRLTDDQKHTNGYHVDLIHHSINKCQLQDVTKYELPKYGMYSQCNSTIIQMNRSIKARQKYDPEEDDAILQYIVKHKKEYGVVGSLSGNLIWKEMELKKVTQHSWQSMKDRCKKHLHFKEPSFNFEPLTMRMNGGKMVPFANISSTTQPLEEQPSTSTSNNTTKQLNETNQTAQHNDAKNKIKRRKMFSTKQQQYFAETPETSVRSTETPKKTKCINTTTKDSTCSSSNDSVDLFQLVSSDENDSEIHKKIETRSMKKHKNHQNNHVTQTPSQLSADEGDSNEPHKKDFDSPEANLLPSPSHCSTRTKEEHGQKEIQFSDIDIDSSDDEMNTFDEELLKVAKENTSLSNENTVTVSQTEKNLEETFGTPENLSYLSEDQSIVYHMSPNAESSKLKCDCFVKPSWKHAIRNIQQIDQTSAEDEIWEAISAQLFLDEFCFNNNVSEETVFSTLKSYQDRSVP